MAGWGTWIRTRTDGVRDRCSTVKLFPTCGRTIGAPPAVATALDAVLTESALPFPTDCVKHLQTRRRGFELK